MATLFYDKDADLSLIRDRKVAIIGYGSQGHAHALNLKDSGVSVKVGLPASSRSRAKAQAAGLAVGDVAEVTKWADVVMMLIPDTTQPKVYREEIEPNLSAGSVLMFAHGFNISTLPADRFGSISSRYTFGCVVSGMSIITTSAHLVTSATSPTARPAACALARDRLVAGSPTFTLTPLSFRFSACAWPWEP